MTKKQSKFINLKHSQINIQCGICIWYGNEPSGNPGAECKRQTQCCKIPALISGYKCMNEILCPILILIIMVTR
jgi:hypothetical protein